MLFLKGISILIQILHLKYHFLLLDKNKIFAELLVLNLNNSSLQGLQYTQKM
jgi:hypothetical protein